MQRYLRTDIIRCILVALTLAAAVIAIAIASGCAKPPAGTMEIIIDGKPVLVQDADNNKVPDLDAAGALIIDPRTKYWKAAAATDSIVPAALTTAGALSGLSLLTVIGSLWKIIKPSQTLLTTIMSVQAARKALNDNGYLAALEVVDKTLDNFQPGAAREMIRKIKDELKLEPIIPVQPE